MTDRAVRDLTWFFHFDHDVPFVSDELALLVIARLARHLTGPQYCRAIRRILDLGAGPSLEALQSPGLQNLDTDLRVDLLSAPDKEIRSIVLLYLVPPEEDAPQQIVSRSGTSRTR